MGKFSIIGRDERKILHFLRALLWKRLDVGASYFFELFRLGFESTA
jgi:hypothetical protein